jgi:tight adherence protein C
MVLYIAIAMIFGAVYLLLAGLTVQQRDVALTVRKAKRYGTRNQREIETRRSLNDRLVGPISDHVAAVVMRFLPRTDQAQIHSRLLAAGLGRSMTPQMYLAIKGAVVGFSVLMGLLALIAGTVAPLFCILLAVGGAALGIIGPDFYINSRIRGRGVTMQAELPNVLDLLCVSVEAGLGFDSALVKLSERMKGPLVDEFSLVLHEMRIGESRAAALRNLSERVDVPEVSQFCRALIQADQLGIALSRILRVQSHDMRIRRQLAAEEKAMKAPVKMLFPTVIFIFPAMFVVALGPAMLDLLKTFSSG